MSPPNEFDCSSKIYHGKTDRKRGILTEKDREYLLGEYEPEGQSKRNTRYRIRQRIIHSLFDLKLLSFYLDYEDIEQIMDNQIIPENIFKAVLMFGWRFGWTIDLDTLRPSGFVHEGEYEFDRAMSYFERILENSIQNAIFANSPVYESGADMDEDLENKAFSYDVDVDLSISSSQHDLDNIFEKLKTGEATQEELETWLRHGDPDTLRKYKEDSDEPLRFIHPLLEKPVEADITTEDMFGNRTVSKLDRLE